MLRTFFIVVVQCFALTARAQDATYYPYIAANVEMIVEKSKLTYRIRTDTAAAVECRKYYRRNAPFTYVVEKGLLSEPAVYVLSKKGRRLLERGRRHLRADRPDLARRCYRRFTRLHPEISTGWVYLARTYSGKDADSTAVYLTKALLLNNYDHLAHYSLADYYYQKKQFPGAVSHIIRASILDRNNPEILQLAKRIFEASDRSFLEWCFEPQIRITTATDGSVEVSTPPDWASYAMAKAVWECEPGYREKNSSAADSFDLAEEEEALGALAEIKYADSLGTFRSGRSPALGYLPEPFFSRYDGRSNLVAYLLYEVVLPRYPSYVYRMGSGMFRELEQYILFAHVK